MKTKTLPTLLILVIAYFLFKYFIPFGSYIIYPVNLLVTFMHEFGHAFFTLIFGGNVDAIKVNADGSGLANTSGGWRSVTLMGGYIGSAVFGNILLWIGFNKHQNNKLSQNTIYVLSGVMIFAAIFWYGSIISSLILLFISAILILLAKKTDFDNVILQFLGIASLLFIIEDFNVGPSSDLSKFTEIFVFIPQSAWMIIWLVFVLIITGLNLKIILKK